MKKRSLVLLASGALLFASCTAVNPNQNNNNNNSNNKNNGENNNQPIIEDDPEFSEFDLLSSSSSYGRSMVGKALSATIDKVMESTAVKVTGNVEKANIDISAKEDADRPRYSLRETIDDFSGDLELGLSGYTFKRGKETGVSDLIGYLNVNDLNAKSNLTYQLSNELLNDNSKTTTTVTNESQSKNGKAYFYLKDSDVYGDLSDENMSGLVDTISKVGEIANLELDELEEIAENPKFKITNLFDEGKVNLYNTVNDKIPLLLISEKTITGAIESVDRDEELKEELEDIFTTLDLKFYSAIQKSDYYFKVTFNLDEVSDFITVINYLNDKANEDSEEEFVPSDFAKELEEMNVELTKTVFSGEVRFAKTGNLEADINVDLEMNYKDELDLSEYEDFKVQSLSLDSSLKFKSTLSVKADFENKSYLNKLPSEEELANYYEIDGTSIREKIDELIELYKEQEDGQD